LSLNLGRRSSFISPTGTFTLPHRPAPAIPDEKLLNSNENNQTTEHIYLQVKEIPQSLIKENKILQTKILEEEIPVKEKFNKIK
jgi:hypothetical protein